MRIIISINSVSDTRLNPILDSAVDTRHWFNGGPLGQQLPCSSLAWLSHYRRRGRTNRRQCFPHNRHGRGSVFADGGRSRSGLRHSRRTGPYCHEGDPRQKAPLPWGTGHEFLLHNLATCHFAGCKDTDPICPATLDASLVGRMISFRLGDAHADGTVKLPMKRPLFVAESGISTRPSSWPPVQTSDQ